MDKLTNELVGLKYSKPKIYTFSPCLKMEIAIKSNSMREAYYSRVFMFVPNCVYVCVWVRACVCACVRMCVSADIQRQMNMQSSTVSVTLQQSSLQLWPSRKNKNWKWSARYAHVYCTVLYLHNQSYFERIVCALFLLQALLQVAKNLFTHLGKLASTWNGGYTKDPICKHKTAISNEGSTSPLCFWIILKHLGPLGWKCYSLSTYPQPSTPHNLFLSDDVSVLLQEIIVEARNLSGAEM